MTPGVSSLDAAFICENDRPAQFAGSCSSSSLGFAPNCAGGDNASAARISSSLLSVSSGPIEPKFYLGVPYETNIGSIGPEDLALPDLGPSQFVVYDPTGRTFNLLNPVPLNVGISAGAIIPGYFHPNGAPVTVESVQANIFSTVVTIRAVEYINGEGETILSPGAAFRDPTAGEKSENPDAYLNPWEKYNILNAPAVLNGTLASTYLSQDFKSYTCGNNNTRELFLSQNVILKPKNKLVNEKQRVRITNWYPSLFSNAQYNKKVFAVNAGQTSAYSFTKIHNEYNEDNEAQNVGSLYSFNENLISLSNPKVDESVTINDLVKIEYEPSFEINYLNLHTDVESFFEGVSPYTLIDLNISVSTVLENMASPLFMQTDRRGLVEDWKDNSHPDLISQGDIALIIQSKKRRRITHINQTVKDRIYENLPTGNYEPINNLSGETFPIVNDDWISGTLVFNATESVNIVLSDEFTHSCPDIHYKVPVSDIIATSGTTQALIRDIDSLFIEHDSDAWSGIELDAKIPSADVIYLKNYGIVDILSEGNFNGETGFKSLSHANALTGLSTSPKSLKPGQLVQTYYYPSDDMYRKGYAQVSYSLDVTSSFNYNPTTGVFTIPGHDFGNFELVRVSWNDAFAPVNVAPPENDPELYTQRYVLLKKVEGSDDDFELLLNPTLSAGSIGAVVQELYNSVSSSITKWIPQIEPGATVPHIVLYSFGMVHGDIEYLRTIDSRISASSNELEKNVVLPAFTYFANRGADPQIGEVDQIVAVITTESGTDVNGANTFKFVLPDNLAGGNIFAAEGGITTKFMLNGWETFQDKVFTVRETIEDGFGKQVIFETSEQLIQFQNNGDVVPKAVTVGEVVKIYDASTARANTQYPNININVISSKYDPIEVGDKRIEFFEISPLQTRTNLTMTIDTVDFDETTGEVSMTFRNTYNIPQSQMLTSEAYNGYDNLGVDVDPDPKFIHVVRHDKGLYDASTYEFCKDIISIPLTQDVPAGANVLTVADTTNLNIGQVVQFAGFIPTAATIVNKTQTTITISASTLKELKQDYVLTVADDNLQDYELCSVSLNTAPPFEGTEDGLKTVAGNENLIVNDIVFDGLILNNQPVSQIGVDTNGNIDYSYTQSIDITYADQKTDGQTVYKLAIK